MEKRLRRGRRSGRALTTAALVAAVAGGSAAWRWSPALLCGLAAAALWRATGRSRAALYGLLGRAVMRREPRPSVIPRPTSSYDAQAPYTPGARLRAGTDGLGRALLELLLDERGRAGLALNLLTHGLLTALLRALTHALRA